MEGNTTSQMEVMENSATVVVKCFGLECYFLEDAIKAFLKCFGFEFNESSSSSPRSEKEGEVKESTGSNTGKEATNDEEEDPPSTAESSAADPSTTISVQETAATAPPINSGSGPQTN